MSWSKIVSAKAGNQGPYECTLSDVNTTNVTALMLIMAHSEPADDPPISDNKTNDWLPIISAENVGSNKISAFLANPASLSVGLGHEFYAGNVFPSAAYPSLILLGLADTSPNSSPLDQENNANVFNDTSLNSGSIIPTAGGSAIISCMGWSEISAPSVDSGLTIEEFWDNTASYLQAIAWKEQAGTGAINPLWQWTGNNSAAGITFNLKTTAGGGGGIVIPTVIKHLRNQRIA